MTPSGPDIGGTPLPQIPDRSLGAMLAARAARDPERVAVRSRSPSGKWVDLSWKTLDQRRRSIARGLLAAGVEPGDSVAVISANSPEMLLAEAAILSAGAVSVPLFPDSPADVLSHCLADSGARVAFVASAVQQHRSSVAKGLERVVVLDDQPLPDDRRALPLRSLDAAEGELPDTGPDDLAFLLYTGGTTGRPKGVELTHFNVLSQQAAMSAVWNVSERDIFLSALPWHHCFGALFERFMALWHRALLVVDDSRGRDLDRLLANWGEVKPTLYFAVPRVYSALAARARRDPKARKTIFHGGLRFVFSAAAPVREETVRAFEENGTPVLEGWGLTETSPCVTVSRLDRPRAPGVVGWPLPGTDVKIAPSEQSPHSGAGEVLVRGPQVMRGYRHLPAETAKVLRDGWLHTGDLAEWTPSGLRLIGRADGVFKLENGEKVSAGEAETRIVAATPLLEHCVVFGAGQPFVTALCWIAQGPARRWLEDHGLEAPASLAEVAQVPELRRAIVEALQASNLTATVPYERVRRVALVPTPPSPGAGEITDTLRMVRTVSGELHADLVSALRDERPHPLVVDVVRRGDAFGHA